MTVKKLTQGKTGDPAPDSGLVIALRPQTPKHIKGGWSHYTDTSEPADGAAGHIILTPANQLIGLVIALRPQTPRS
jgi:hypothetical protein